MVVVDGLERSLLGARISATIRGRSSGVPHCNDIEPETKCCPSQHFHSQYANFDENFPEYCSFESNEHKSALVQISASLGTNNNPSSESIMVYCTDARVTRPREFNCGWL